ncbi:hypothetical protein HMSSN036_36270 [Paenibacillus macerans]|nr:hypothetical protein HMSSN036_36270 [Paenibacillus macerans]
MVGFDRDMLGSSVGKPERVVLALTDQGFADMVRKAIAKTSEVEYIE